MAKKEENLNETKKTPSKTKSTKDKKNSFGMKVAKYFKDLKSEFKKVVWPSKKDVFNSTSVVLLSIVIMGVFVFALDTGLLKLMNLILNKG